LNFQQSANRDHLNGPDAQLYEISHLGVVMGLPDLELPDRSGFEFGMGVAATSGSPKNLAVEGEITGVQFASGVSSQGFNVTRLNSSRDLQQKLGIDVSASYGVGSFGAGISARIGFTQESQVQQSSLFMSVVCNIKLARLSIDHPKLTNEASELMADVNAFNDRFGDMFIRGCHRGGLFVGVIQIDATSEKQKTEIEGELKGGYGLFSAELKTKFSAVAEKHDARVYCSMYSEGGPAFDTRHPEDPAQLLDYANKWFSALHSNPDSNATPYTWHLSPMTVASAPAPPNSIEIAHAQDVIRFCAQERLAILDNLNLFNHMVNYPGRFAWDNSVSPEVVSSAARQAQEDLDLISDCASHAMRNTTEAVLPQSYATSRGKTYKAMPAPSPLPKLIGELPTGETYRPAPPAIVPDWQPGDSVNLASYGGNRVSDSGVPEGAYIPGAAEAGLKLELVYDPPNGGGPFMIGQVSPPSGTPVLPGSTVVVTCVLGQARPMQ
jgi:hypothetical protein